MKLFGTLSGILLFSAVTFAAKCPNFSGNYFWTGNGTPVSLSIHQQGCDKLDAIYDYGNNIKILRPMTLDGVKRPVIGMPTDAESYQLKDGKILVDHIGQLNGKPQHTTGEISLDENKNLVEETTFYNENGQVTGSNLVQFTRK